MRWLPFRLLTALAVLVLLLLSGKPTAAREPDELATIAVKIEGTKADQVHSAIVEVAGADVDFADEAAFKKELARTGLPGGVMGWRFVPQQRPRLFKRVRKAMQALELDGAVLGQLRWGHKGLMLYLAYIEPEGEPLVEMAMQWPKAKPEQIVAIEDALGAIFDMLAPVEPEPEPPPPPPKPVEEESSFEPHQVGSELFSAQLNTELGGRFFSYDEGDGNSQNLRPYSLFGVPAIHFGGEIFPAATTDVPVVRDLGLTLSYMHALGLSSETEDGQYAFDTTFHRLWAGLRFRYRIGEADERPVVLNATGSFGYLAFTMDPEDDLAVQIQDEVATAEYLLLRAAIGARIPLGEIAAMQLGLGYVGPLSGGEVYDRFSDSSLAALDAELLFALAVGHGFELQLGAEYTGIFASFEPAPGDLYVAESATDHYLAIRLGSVFYY